MFRGLVSGHRRLKRAKIWNYDLVKWAINIDKYYYYFCKKYLQQFQFPIIWWISIVWRFVTYLTRIKNAEPNQVVHQNDVYAIALQTSAFVHFNEPKISKQSWKQQRNNNITKRLCKNNRCAQMIKPTAQKHSVKTSPSFKPSRERGEKTKTTIKHETCALAYAHHVLFFDSIMLFQHIFSCSSSAHTSQSEFVKRKYPYIKMVMYTRAFAFHLTIPSSVFVDVRFILEMLLRCVFYSRCDA